MLSTVASASWAYSPREHACARRSAHSVDVSAYSGLGVTLAVQCVSSSVEPGTRPSQEMVGPDAARDGDTASPYGRRRKEREASPSVAIGARAIMARAVVSAVVAVPLMCADHCREMSRLNLIR